MARVPTFFYGWGRKIVFFLLLCAVLAAAPKRRRFSSRAASLPEGAVVVLDVLKPRAVLAPLLDPAAEAALRSLPGYKKILSEPGVKKFLDGVSYLEIRLGTTWRKAVLSLFGGGVTLAAYPDGATILVADGTDRGLLAKLKSVFRDFPGAGAHSIVGKRLVFSNRAEFLEKVLALKTQKKGAFLDSKAFYREPAKILGRKAVAFLSVDLELLKKNPDFKRRLQERPDPGAALLIPGVAEVLRGSRWTAVGLYVSGRKATLRAVSDGTLSQPVPYAWPADERTALPANLCVPGRIAAASFFRDLGRFYAAKEDLFPQRTSGLIFFENMMGIFFTGRDLTDEVLAQLGPEVRFVAARQKYDSASGTPRVKVPAFAAVFRLRHPEKFRVVMEEAWQKAVGLINFTRGQKALAGLIIDRPVHKGTKFTTAYFAPEPGEEVERNALPIRYNFKPSLAFTGNYMIMSSTEKLARDLVDALRGKRKGRPIPGMNTLLEVDGGSLLAILKANRENFVRRNMVEKGNTLEEAEREVDLLLALVERVREARFSLGKRAEWLEAILEFEFNKF